ncbi:fatty-acid amide hydrolase 2-A-like [Diaphorina citri]|uniref:Fatty-acid amide hydrolase 2-A-like n=1 Tax=Diaphorina citri TaxID=121845 RepID=A0A3Q0J7M3_DIACI|nr:fatty-acid amide hydrolase 2-A-like [Diaphorina citri]
MCSPKSASSNTPDQSSRRHSSKNRLTFLRTFLIFVRVCFDSFINIIFSFIYKDEAFPLPPVKNKIVLESATQIAKKIRNKNITSVEVVQAFIERIEQVNPYLNAMVDTRYTEALEEAKAADQKIALEEDISDKPYLGVPFTSKESTACKGLSNTLGLLARKGKKADADAYIVERVKTAGGILLGNTNIPELLWSESRNMVYGQSNNPYNLCRTTGASSGGEACLVSACGSVLGLGTDLGGSNRIPALYCGVYGHKLTTGSVNSRGIYGRDGKEGKSMLAAGPIVKHAEDLLPYSKCLILPDKLPAYNFDKSVDLAKLSMLAAGPIVKHAEDLLPYSKCLILPDKLPAYNFDKPVDLAKLKVFYVEEPGDMKVSPMSKDMIQAIRKCVNALKVVSHSEPEDLSYIKQFRLGYDVWRYWVSKEKDDFNQLTIF